MGLVSIQHSAAVWELRILYAGVNPAGAPHGHLHGECQYFEVCIFPPVLSILVLDVGSWLAVFFFVSGLSLGWIRHAFGLSLCCLLDITQPNGKPMGTQWD